MHLPPSTSRLTPVMNLASSLAMKTHTPATSWTSPMRPRGTFEVNLARFSGVSSMPLKAVNRPVAVSSGQMLTTRIWCGPYSAASPFVAYIKHKVSKEPTYNSRGVQEIEHEHSKLPPWTRCTTPTPVLVLWRQRLLC